MSIPDIQKMTPQQRLQTMEALWDAMIHEATEPASPEWHAEILSARRAKIEAGEAEFVSLAELKRGRQG